MVPADLIKPRQFTVSHTAPERWIVTEEILGRSWWRRMLCGATLIGGANGGIFWTYGEAMLGLDRWKNYLLERAARDLASQGHRTAVVYTETWPRSLPVTTQ